MTDADALVVEHVEWARRLARIARSQYHLVALEPEDAEGVALEALVHCARKFRPETGVPFQGYARVRVTGAVIDLFHRYYGRAGRRVPRQAVPLGLVVADAEVLDRIASAAPTPLELLERAISTSQLDPLLERLHRRESRIIRLHYLEGWTLKQIGDSMAVTESRVCQIEKEILVRLDPNRELTPVERLRIAKRESARRNRAKGNATTRAWLKRNREKQNAYVRGYWAARPDHGRRLNRAKRARVTADSQQHALRLAAYKRYHAKRAAELAERSAL